MEFKAYSPKEPGSLKIKHNLFSLAQEAGQNYEQKQNLFPLNTTSVLSFLPLEKGREQI